jgi:hypothetical protein
METNPEGGAMPRLFIHCRSAEVESRIQALLRDREARWAYGCRGEQVFRNERDATERLVVLEWDNLDRARLYAESDEFLEALNVDCASRIWVVDDSSSLKSTRAARSKLT